MGKSLKHPYDLTEMQLWDSIYNSYPDQSDGQREADKAIALMRKGKDFDKWNARLNLASSILRALAGPAKVALILVLIAVAITGLVIGIAAIPGRVNHYANERRADVPKDAASALGRFFSPNPVPFLVTESITKSNYLSIPAYRVVYLTKTNTPICVFVWRKDAQEGGATTAITRTATCAAP